MQYVMLSSIPALFKFNLEYYKGNPFDFSIYLFIQTNEFHKKVNLEHSSMGDVDHIVTRVTRFRLNKSHLICSVDRTFHYDKPIDWLKLINADCNININTCKQCVFVMCEHSLWWLSLTFSKLLQLNKISYLHLYANKNKWIITVYE